MCIRTMVMVAGLAALAGGCAVHEHEYEERRYHSSYGVYHEDDSYEGYYYVRIVYINGAPWYVDDYRRARPVPRHLHPHFRHSAWVRSLPPRFGRDDETRDGYRVSRIVYINDVPHYVDDGRRARPVPSRLRSRFNYVTVVRGDDHGGRPGFERGQDRRMPPAHAQEGERREPEYRRGHEREPAMLRERLAREQEHEARMRAREEEAFARGRGREEQPAHLRMREREEVPYRAEVMRGRPEPVRDERGAPPFARAGEEAPPGRGAREERGPRGDERRAGPARGDGYERSRDAGYERGDGRAQRVVERGEQRAESAPEDRRGRGRGRDRDEEEDGREGRGKHRGE